MLVQHKQDLKNIVWHKLLIVADKIIPTIVELVYPLDAVPERWKPEGSFQEQKWSGVKSGRKKSMLVYKYEHLLHNTCDELLYVYSCVGNQGLGKSGKVVDIERWEGESYVSFITNTHCLRF